MAEVSVCALYYVHVMVLYLMAPALQYFIIFFWQPEQIWLNLILSLNCKLKCFWLMGCNPAHVAWWWIWSAVWNAVSFIHKKISQPVKNMVLTLCSANYSPSASPSHPFLLIPNPNFQAKLSAFLPSPSFPSLIPNSNLQPELPIIYIEITDTFVD